MIVEEMSLEDLMLGYLPFYPGDDPTWADTLSYLLNQPASRIIVDDLIKVLQEDGDFNSPIILETIEIRDLYNAVINEKGDAPDDIEGALRVIDGVHRIAAAYLVQHPVLTVSYMEENAAHSLDKYEEPTELWLEASQRSHLATSIVLVESDEGNEGSSAAIMQIVDNFELSLRPWMQGVCLQDRDGTVWVLWNALPEDLRKMKHEIYKDITQHVRATLDKHGIKYLDVSTSVELETDIIR